MLGRMIDQTAGTVLGATTLYLLLLNAGAGIPVSCVGTFVLMTLMHRITTALPRRSRVSKSRAKAALLAIARMSETEAGEALRQLSGREDVVCVLRHPGAELSADALLALWRAHMGEGDIAVAVTCPASQEATSLAETLTAPRVTLIDGLRLTRIIRTTGRYVPPMPKPEPWMRRWKRTLCRLSSHPPRMGMALYGLSLVSMYMTMGHALCLAAGLGLLGIFGVGWIRRLT